MSRENVEIVRRGLEAFNRGDLEHALGMYDRDVEVRTLLSGSAHGRDQLRALIEERERVIGPVRYLPDELIDAGETIVGVVRAVGTARRSGISDQDFAAATKLAFVWRLRRGLVVRQEMFSNKADALEAAGLSSE